MKPAILESVPTIHEELARKALETIEKLHFDHEHGRTTEAQYSYGIDILWSAIAGIAGEDFVRLTEAMKPPKRNGSYFTREFYLSPIGVIVKITNFHDGLVTLEKIHSKAGQVNYDFREDPDGLLKANDMFKKLGDSLHSRDFELI